MSCFVPEAAFGQQSGPGTAWTAGVDFKSNSPVGEDTWAFDAVEMANGDFVVVGYAETNGGATRVPAYAVLDKFGTLKYSKHYDAANGGGAFSQISKTPDGGCILVGYQGQKSTLTKLMANYSEEWSGQFDLAPNNGVERLYSVSILPSGKILLSGGIKGAPSLGELDSGDSFFVLCHYDVATQSIVIDNTFRFNDVKGRILDCKTVTVGSNTYVLSTGYKVIRKETVSEADWKFEVQKHDPEDITDKNADRASLDGKKYLIFDYDVLVGIFDVALLESGTLTSDVFKIYNSKSFPYNSFGSTQEIKEFVSPTPVSNNLWKEPNCGAQFGPCTPNKSAGSNYWSYDPNILNLNNGSPVIDHYLSNVSKDIGRSIIYTNGYVYVAAEMNTLEMTSSFYTDMHRNGLKGVRLDELDCDDPLDQSHLYGAYKDAYIHLLKFNLDGTLAQSAPNAPNVENVTHASGGDFYATIVADQTDGKIVLATTTCDRGICNLPPIDDCKVAEAHLLMKIDPVTLQPVWQQHYLSDQEGLEGSCAFGLIQTADNGFVILGNNELEGGDETFTIVKFNSDCISKASFTDGDFTVPAGQGFFWGPPFGNRRVNGLVTIPSGSTLIISGITVEFANSKNLPGLKKCGIVVQPGGKLILKNGAILTGLSGCGSPQMWDGIIALGNTHLAQTPAMQAFVEIEGNSRIENAIRGTVLGDAAWATEETGVALQNGTIGTVAHHNYFETYTRGGGKLTVNNSTYKNCGKGVVWNPYTKFSNLSTLTDAHFECTSALADPEYQHFFSAVGEPTSTETFCEIQSNRGIQFVNCTAKNTASSALFPHPRNKPSGIYCIDGQFKVDGPSTIFQNLYVGITAGGIASGIPSAISVNTAHFANVYQGINLVGTMGTEVTACPFGAMPNTSSMLEDGAASGIFCTKATAYTLRSNILSGSATNYGMVSRHSGLNGALIEGNTLSSFSLLANLFEYDNSVLQTHCNTYQGDVADVSWDVKGVLAAQGKPNDPNYYPDNRFVWTCVEPDLLDIRSENPLSYYERTESANNTNTILKCFTPTVTRVPGASDLSANCVIVNPCPNPPDCAGLLANYNASGYALPYRNDLLNAYIRMAPTAVADSLYLPGTTRAITLLAYRNQQADKRMLTATYASIGNFITANQYLQQVTGSDTETQDFVSFYTVLINAGLAGRDVYQLTATEFAQLAPLMTHNTSVSSNVKVLDHIMNGVYHPLQVGTGTGGRPSERTEEDGTPLELNSGLSVFPNPFSDEVQFLAPEGLWVTELRIMDVSGKLLFEQNQISTSEFTWQSKDTPEGILFYQCRLSDGTVTYGKLVHSKGQ